MSENNSEHGSEDTRSLADQDVNMDGESISTIRSQSERGSRETLENVLREGNGAYVLTREQRELNELLAKSRRLRDFHFARLQTLVEGACSEGNIPNLGIEALQAHLNLAEASWEQFEERHMHLVSEGDVTNQRDIDMNHHLYDQAENTWVLLKSRLQGQLNGLRQSLRPDTSTEEAANASGWLNRTQPPGQEPRVHVHGSQATLRIGNISTEAFNGDSSQWANFKSKYLRMVHENPDIGDIEKLSILLKMMTPGTEPHSLLEGYTHEPDNYKIMWKQLCDFYDDDLEIITTLVNRVLDLPVVTRASREALMLMVNVTNKLVLQMPRHNVDTKNWGIILVPLLIRKLDGETRNLWVCDRPQRQKPELAGFLSFLTERARTVSGLNQPGAESSREREVGSSHRTVASRHDRGAFRQARAPPRPVSCYLCKKEHAIYACPDFKAMSVDRRKDAVRTLRLCFLCMKPDCNVAKCTLRACTCGIRHNQMLCTKRSLPSAVVTLAKRHSPKRKAD